MRIALLSNPSSGRGRHAAADDVARRILTDAGHEVLHVRGSSYEQAREELVSVVQRLEAGQVPLEDALALWERGEALAARCQSWLDEARARLAAVTERTSPTS